MGGGKIEKTFFNPNLILIGLLRKSSKIWNDELYCCIMFMLKMGKWPNLSNPITYQEKLNWIKLHFHDTLLTRLILKQKAAKYTFGYKALSLRKCFLKPMVFSKR